MRASLSVSPARPVAAVPLSAKFVLALGLITQVAWQAFTPRPVATAAALGLPADIAWFQAASLGDTIPLAQTIVLNLQAFDNQPGVSVPFRDLDYRAVEAWLQTALRLDPAMQYPLMMAASVYAQVSDDAKQRQMLDFVHREFLRDPERRWRWLAHAAIVAKHRLKDMPLALKYAEDITRRSSTAQSWARQMRIFILEDMGEFEAAAVLLGGLLATGDVTDSAEIRFLTQRLEQLRAVEKSPKPSKYR